MSLFKTGDPIHDEYANHSTEQLIKIVTDTEGFYSEGAVSAARRILLTRGLDYRTKEQRRIEKVVEASARDRQLREQETPHIRFSRPASGSTSTGLKWWQWIWIIVVLVRIIGCLIKNSH